MAKQKTTPDWTEILSTLENLVQNGQHLQAKKNLDALNFQQIPRAHALALAELAWRMSHNVEALKILNPLIHPKNTFAKPASGLEKLTYGSVLVNLGAHDEALEIFESIDFRSHPEVLLRKAICHFKSWNYATSIPLLQLYVEQKSISPYKRLIGQVNLAAALVDQCQWKESLELIHEIQSECEKNSYTLLLGNSFELEAQIHFFQRNFDSASMLLERAKNCLEHQNGDFLLYAEKWWLICNCFKSRDENKHEEFSNFLNELHDLKARAAQLRHWETIRECDLFESILTQNEDLARKVIMGTPIENYRQRVRRLFGSKLSLRGQYTLDLGQIQVSSREISLFDPYKRQKGGEGLFEKPLFLSLFEALTFDFYKPRHLGDLFQKIYPGEKFNPFSSPERVLKLMKRLNVWFVQQDVPLRIRLKKSEFSLTSHENQKVNVLISRGKKLSAEAGYFNQLKELFTDRPFSSEQVAEKLEISRTKAQTLIQQALDSGQAARIGTGRATRYQLKPRAAKSKAA